MTISFAQIIFPLIQTLFEMVNYYIDLKPCINEAMNSDKIYLKNENMILYTKKHKENYFVKNLTVQFSEKQIINNLSLEFKRNGLYIIQGSNGKGKSTLLKSIARIYPATNGETNINIEDSCYLLQENYLIPGSLYFNITLSEHLKNDEIEDIFNLAEILNIKDKITSFENGLETILDFDDIRFSGGEKRKICILRTLFQAKNKDIIFLDEPDASLDVESVEKLFNYLIKLAEKKFILVVSHSELKSLSNNNLNFINW